MTEAPPPPRPDDETVVDHQPVPSEPTEPVAATPATGWPEPPAQPPRRQWVSRLRGSKVALVVAGLVVAAGLVLGGVALADGGGRGDRDGRGGPGAAGPRDSGNGGRFDGGNGERGNAGRGNAGRVDGGENDGARGGRGGNRNGAAGQQVIGVITAISSTSISVRTSGGTPSYAITATTPVTRAGAAAGVTDLKAGDAVVIRLGSSGSGGTSVVERIAAG